MKENEIVWRNRLFEDELILLLRRPMKRINWNNSL